jgi:hypothetical protein
MRSSGTKVIGHGGGRWWPPLRRLRDRRGSDPEAELAESAAKLVAMRDALSG